MNIKTTTTILAVVSLGISAAHAAAVVWDGGAGNWADSNWNSGDAQPTMDGTDDAVINGGDVTYVPGTDFGLNFATSNVTVSGGTLIQTLTNWWQFDGSTVFTVNGGTVNAGASTILFGTSGSDTASLTLTSGSFNHTGGGEFKIRGSNSVTVAGGSLTTRFFSIGDFGNASFDISSGAINLIDGSLGNAGLYTANGSYINFTTGSTGVFNVGNVSVADATTFYLDSNKVRLNGDTNNALLSVVDDGSGGVNITTVPELSSAALLGLGGLALILRRRK